VKCGCVVLVRYLHFSRGADDVCSVKVPTTQEKGNLSRDNSCLHHATQMAFAVKINHFEIHT
jgi:hypothetical protein